MKPLRTAILGCGRFARKHVVRLAVLEEISLVGFCDSLDALISLEPPVEVRSSQEIE
jgi:predicted dehydrogenase